MLLESLLAFEEVVMQPTLTRKGKDGKSGGSVTWRCVRMMWYSGNAQALGPPWGVFGLGFYGQVTTWSVPTTYHFNARLLRYCPTASFARGDVVFSAFVAVLRSVLDRQSRASAAAKALSSQLGLKS